MFRRFLLVVVAACLSLPLVGVEAQEAPTVSYSIIDLGSLEHPDQEACADLAPGATIAQIGAGNQAVGRAYIDESRSVAALYTPDEIRLMESGPGGGSAEAINRQGEIAGLIYEELSDEPCGEASDATPATWNADFEMTPLDLPAGADEGGATAINNDGIVAGWVSGEDGRRAAIWRGDEMLVMPLAAIEGVDAVSSEATGINDDGVVAGTVYFERGDETISQPFLWDGERVQYIELDASTSGSANAINQFGLVSGSMLNDEGFLQAVLWRDGGTTRLDSLPDRPTSVATDSNSGGIAVGYCAREDGLSRATVWIDGAAIDLNELIGEDLGWQLQVAIGINDDGTIAGWGDLDGELRAFLLVPAAG